MKDTPDRGSLDPVTRLQAKLILVRSQVPSIFGEVSHMDDRGIRGSIGSVQRLGRQYPSLARSIHRSGSGGVNHRIPRSLGAGNLSRRTRTNEVRVLVIEE